jgi:hypothetical protein
MKTAIAQVASPKFGGLEKKSWGSERLKKRRTK